MEHRNKVFDNRHLKLDEIMKQGYIPFMEGRPDRILSISDDDITNLIIALHTAETYESFLSQV